jgi:hypothetical protein
MINSLNMKSFASIQIIMLLTACNTGVSNSGSESQRSDSSGRNAPTTSAQVQSNSGASAGPASTPTGLRTLTSKDLLAHVDAGSAATSADAAAKAAPQQGTVSPAELEALLSADVTQRIMAAHAAHPNAMSQDDARELATLLCAFLKNATAKDAAAAAESWNILNKKILAIAAKQQGGLGLYDNSNIMGRFLNAGNSFVDVAAEFYGAIISLSPKQAAGAGESAVRSIMNLFS